MREHSPKRKINKRACRFLDYMKGKSDSVSISYYLNFIYLRILKYCFIQQTQTSTKQAPWQASYTKNWMLYAKAFERENSHHQRDRSLHLPSKRLLRKLSRSRKVNNYPLETWLTTNLFADSISPSADLIKGLISKAMDDKPISTMLIAGEAMKELFSTLEMIQDVNQYVIDSPCCILMLLS